MDLCLGVSFKNIESPNPQKSSFGEVLEAFLACPEVSWAVLACLGRASRACLGASWSARGYLGAILGGVGAILECFGRIWERFGRVLEASWERFWKFSVILKKMRK